jgi:hypothetical protein
VVKPQLLNLVKHLWTRRSEQYTKASETSSWPELWPGQGRRKKKGTVVPLVNYLVIRTQFCPDRRRGKEGEEGKGSKFPKKVNYLVISRLYF